MKINLMDLLLPDFKPPRGAKGENLICLEIASWLREESLTKDFSFVWFHVPNQFAGTYKGVFGSMLSWMGRIAGVPDYVFLGKGKCFCVEVKTAKGTQSENQIMFQQWCEKVGVPYYVCRSLEEVEKILKVQSSSSVSHT